MHNFQRYICMGFFYEKKLFDAINICKQKNASEMLEQLLMYNIRINRKHDLIYRHLNSA